MSISQLQTFDPTLETQGQLDTHLSGPCGILYLLNESLESLLLTTDTTGGRVIGILPALWAQPFVINNPPPSIAWGVISSQNATDTTIQKVQGLSYTQDEDTSKLYSGPLPRIANVGNPGSVSSNVTTNNSNLSNTGSAAGASLLSSVVAGQTSPSVSLTNDAILNLAVLIGGVLTQILTTNNVDPVVGLGIAGHLTKVFGTLEVAQGATLDSTLDVTGASTLGSTLGVTGASSLDNGKLTTDGAGHITKLLSILFGGAVAPVNMLGLLAAGDVLQITNPSGANWDVHLSPLGSGQIRFDNASAFTPNVSSDGKFNAPNGITGNIGGFKDINNGTSLSGTVNHGLSGTPAAVLCVCTTSSSSATVGAYSYTSTQFGMTIGASLNGRWWAYR